MKPNYQKPVGRQSKVARKSDRDREQNHTIAKASCRGERIAQRESGDHSATYGLSTEREACFDFRDIGSVKLG